MALEQVRAMTTSLSRLIESQGELLDEWAKAVQGPLGSAVRNSGPIGRTATNLLHGVGLGHPLHPVLSDIPIGAWTSGVLFDLLGLEDAADASFAFGSLAAAPTAMAGTADWLEITDEQRRIGFVHAALNAGALTLIVSSLVARGRGRRTLGIGLSSLGYSLAALSGWLGGELVYVLGAGVNHNAFELPAANFQVAADLSELKEGSLTAARIRVENQDVALVLLRRGQEVLALNGTCSHAGGPLAEGKLVDTDCVECPWHGSRFSLRDGSVQQGPASVPQPVFETRVQNGRVEVRQLQTT